jgi:hypothetical protein
MAASWPRPPGTVTASQAAPPHRAERAAHRAGYDLPATTEITDDDHPATTETTDDDHPATTETTDDDHPATTETTDDDHPATTGT